MKLRLFNFENCQDTQISNESVTVINCAHSATFRNFVANFKGVEDAQTELAILKNNQPIDLKKSCFVITDFFDFSVNSKALISKLYGKIVEDNIAEIDMNTKFQTIFADILANIENLIQNAELNLQTVSTIDIKDFFKFVDLKLIESLNPLERVLDFVQLNNYMKLYDIIVLVNPKSYFSNKDMVEIYRFALYNEITIIVLEGSAHYQKLDYEQIISIDEDLFDVYM